MKLTLKAAFGLAALVAASGLSVSASAQYSNIHIPESSIERPEDLGRRAHTNHQIIVNPAGRPGPFSGSGPSGSMIPSDFRRFYNLPSTGGSGIIAIVDAYHSKDPKADFNAFSAAYGLPQETGSGNVLQVVYQGSTAPAYNAGWSQEAALDIQWAHAMAPNAKILLVEANSNSYADLMACVNLATSMGAKQVSMSWGGGEFSSQTTFDNNFKATSAVYLASSGDSGGRISYPSSSPWVVCVGGTTLNTDANHQLISETGWSGSGGGASAVEPKPSYQVGIAGTPSTRGCPDISCDADPNTGALVYWEGNRYIIGGTSLSAPAMAGMLNLSGVPSGGSQAELARIYSNCSYGVNMRDIVAGRAGKFRCKPGWDLVTGLGAPWGLGVF
jgi:kumamolisin